MKKVLVILFALVTLIACTNSATTENETVTKEEHTGVDTTQKRTLQTGCYIYEKDGNNIQMHITKINEHVTADLTISYAEKDKNQGKFVGTLHGDKLIGIYTFTSEGTESSREIAFLVKDKQLIEGYGAQNENGTAFKDKNTIEYTSTMPLTKMDCDK